MSKTKTTQEAPEFELADLDELTFEPALGGGPVSVADATPQQFETHIRRYTHGLRNVNPEWPVVHRLHILNTMYAECRDRFLPFPFSGCHKKARKHERFKTR